MPDRSVSPAYGWAQDDGSSFSAVALGPFLMAMSVDEGWIGAGIISAVGPFEGAISKIKLGH
jgi:hypothetical protein